MIRFYDKVGASLQKLEQILTQYAVLDGFSSELKNRNDADISNEIIQTILSEIEPFLTEESSCEIDQVSGRIETKFAKLGVEGVSITDESLEKIKLKLFEFFSDLSKNNSFEVSDQNALLDNADASRQMNITDDSLVDADSDNDDNKSDIKSFDTAEMIFDILNNINKDEKLKDFKEFLTEISPKHKQYSLFSRSVTAKTLDEILPKVKFFKQFQKTIEKFTIKRARPLLKMAEAVEKYQKQFEEIHESLTKNLLDLAKKSLRLTVEIFKLAGTNIILAGSYLILAASKIVLAASILVLAASNIVIALSRLILLSAVVLFTIGVMTAVFAFIAATVLSIGLCVVLAFGAIMLTSVLVTATLIAMTALIVISVGIAFALTVGSALFMASCMIVGAMVLSVIGIIAALPVIGAILLAGSTIAAAILVGGVLLSLSAFLFANIILLLAVNFLLLTDVWSIDVLTIVLSISLVINSIVSSVTALATVFTAGISAQLAISIALISAAVSLAIALQMTLITAAIVILTATAMTLTFVLLLGLFVVLILGFIYLRDRIIEELQKTTLYDWWTKDVKQAGGLWEWIKGWFLKQWPWLEDIWGYVKKCVIDAFHDTWIYKWWVDEIEAAGGLWSWIKYRLTSVWDWMTDLPVRIWNYLSNWLAKTCSGLQNFGQTFINAINEWWESSSIKECLDSILNWLTNTKEKIMEGAQKAVDTAGNAMTLGSVDKIKDIGDTYVKATQELADTTARANKQTNDFVKNTSVDKLDSEIDRLENLWQAARKCGGGSGLVYAQTLNKLRGKRNQAYLDAALNLLAANSMDLTELINKRDYIKKWRKCYPKKNGVNEAMDTVKKLDARISGIQDGTIKVEIASPDLDSVEKQKHDETISVPGAETVKAGESKREQKMEKQTNDLNKIGSGEQAQTQTQKYQPVPVPVPTHSAIFTR